MYTLTELFKAQSKYGVTTVVSDSETTTYEMYLISCRRMIVEKTPLDYYSWERKRQNDYFDNLLIQYVRNNIKVVEGFVDENGEIMQDALIDRLRTDIIDYGILRIALEDDTVQEIQINDFKTIWVVRRGKAELFCDEFGKPYQFVSDMELHSTIDRMIFNPTGNTPRMTKTAPLLNTRTVDKGYRLSAVDSTAITPDSHTGFSFPCTSVTIRKYAPSMLTFDDFCSGDNPSMTPEMADFLKKLGKANTRLACVGQTSSGKTTLLNAIAWEVDPELRLILIQNPTEIMIYQRSEETGANMRNALHWEAQDLNAKAAEDPSAPTMGNMMAHTLRNTPDVIIPGEVRTPIEFFQMNRALKTGHRVLTTWHALDGPDAIDRAATELSTLGGNLMDYVRSLATSFNIIISQQKLGDGSRHVMKIEELTGRVVDGRAETVVLFQYTLTGKTDKDPVTGKVKKIHGYYEQLNPISDTLVQSFYQVGITRDEIEPFINVPARLEGRSNLPSQLGVSAKATTKQDTSAAFDVGALFK